MTEKTAKFQDQLVTELTFMKTLWSQCFQDETQAFAEKSYVALVATSAFSAIRVTLHGELGNTAEIDQKSIPTRR